MRANPAFPVTSRETIRHFGVLKGLEKKLFRALKIRHVVITAMELNEKAEQNTDYDGVRLATLDDAGLFENVGFHGTLEKKLDGGPTWIQVGDDGLRAWYCLKKRDCNIAKWLIVRTADKGTIWSDGLWVRRDHRGHGLASQVRAPALRWSRRAGYRTLCAWIERTNHSSLSASRKVGYRLVGRVIAFQRGGLAIVRYGRRWRMGRWTASRPLVISLEDLRRDFGPPRPIKAPS